MCQPQTFMCIIQIPANKANKCIDMQIQPEKNDLANKMKTIVLFELIIRSAQKITHSLAGF